MRSTPLSRQRPGPHRPRQQLIDAVAHVVDDAQVNDSSDHLLIHVIEDSPDVVLGTRVLPCDLHPFVALAGFTAPKEWSAFGLRVHGSARRLEGASAPEPTSTTFLLHRRGEECSLLRHDDTVEELTGPAEGTLPDVCRRVLGRPTAPPPHRTAALWTVAWLDEILTVWSAADPRRRACLSWSDVAVLHPAATAASDEAIFRALHDPVRFLAMARAHSDAWPWTRLRAEPTVLHLPDGDLPAHVTAWMDDGFYARWALGAFPPAPTLARDLSELLPAQVATTVTEAVAGLLG